jgi:hypothetical protein
MKFQLSDEPIDFCDLTGKDIFAHNLAGTVIVFKDSPWKALKYRAKPRVYAFQTPLAGIEILKHLSRFAVYPQENESRYYRYYERTGNCYDDMDIVGWDQLALRMNGKAEFRFHLMKVRVPNETQQAV